MKALATYLVLAGHLAPDEALLFQKIVGGAPLTPRRTKKFLQDAGFPNYKEVLTGLQTKELIKTTDRVTPDWKGISRLIKDIEGHMMTITHDLIKLKQLAEEGQEVSESIATNETEPLSVERVILQYRGNKPTQSETKLLDKVSLLAGIEVLERLAVIGIVKIEPKKRSRTISLTAEGAALRYLFLNKSTLNKVNYDYLEKTFLAPHSESWDSFLEKMSSVETEGVPPEWIKFLSNVFIELEVLRQTENGLELAENKSHPPFSNTQRTTLEESVAGFIPVYLTILHQVLKALKTNRQSKTIQRRLKLGSSTVGGTLAMLIKFQLASKTGDKAKRYQLTPGGETLATLTEGEFPAGFREYIEDYPIFYETLNFTKTAPEGKVGVMDLAGYFRAEGVSNFNPAKAAAVLRIMAQAKLGIREIPGESGTYQLLKEE